MSDYIEALQKAIKDLHGCDSSHVYPIHVCEKFEGKTVWEGEVEMFELEGHPKAHFCYAWTFKEDDGKTRYMAVLELPPVGCAEDAVKAAIASGQQK